MSSSEEGWGWTGQGVPRDAVAPSGLVNIEAYLTIKELTAVIALYKVHRGVRR